MRLLDPLNKTAQGLEEEFVAITNERKELLRQLSDYVREKVTKSEPVQLVYICTHNSRRSHMAQLWAQAAAAYYEVPDVHTFSGGTEATAFNPRAVKAMQELGFAVSAQREDNNPHYEVSYAADTAPVVTWSKRFDDTANPQREFCAIMTCSDADGNCPFVEGAERRIAITYEDPKNFDGTPEEAAKYLERARQIGREMLYVFKAGRQE
ncbi:arsenate reductase [Pontibacter ummariensis]|uniref:Arsenate reductase n=1 Tax=Pontibacter ummariensis TaxID=1610492 RepID=A0A239HWQ7_9BACT|nr:protein-tyrosine-phosphatase [Pontibacter ummariensis]PRY10096.1 arsenate reductase [Pontibacter ummariensis]SNS85745.1 arsenate reductase [Pontibacter ummariensis]